MRTALHAYLDKVSLEILTNALRDAVPNLEPTKSEAVFENYTVHSFESGECKILIHINPELCWPLEIEVKGDISSTEYSGFNNLQFGETLVSVLGGEAIVDCEGAINSVHSDFMVRISKKNGNLYKYQMKVTRLMSRAPKKLREMHNNGLHPTAHALSVCVHARKLTFSHTNSHHMHCG